MSTRNVRRLLYATALLTLPVPFYLGEPELAPVVRLAFLSGLITSVLVAEGGGVNAMLAGIGIVQVLVWAGLLFAAAALLARGLARIPTAGVRTGVAAALAIALFGASLTDLYDTPLSSSRARSNLFQLFE